MSKRVRNHEITTNGKKIKLDEDEEVQWGEDIDDEALDRCFEVASQIYEQNCSQIVHINSFQTYDSFKQPTNFISSTQHRNNANKTQEISINELKQQIQLLKQQNEEKEGEISILRNKIKDNSNNLESAHLKTIKEWRDKWISTTKQFEAIKSELKFKTLELTNLKQDMSDLKRTSLEASQTNLAVNLNVEKSSGSSRSDFICKKEMTPLTTYPLIHIPLSNYTTTVDEKHLIKITSHKLNSSTNSLLQNVDSCSNPAGSSNMDELITKHKCPEQLNGKKIDITLVYTDILKLITSNLDELNDRNVIEPINKIICAMVILLEDLNDYLNGFEFYLRTEDIQKVDADFLFNCDNDLDGCCEDNIYENDKFGIEAGKFLEFLTYLILCNDYTAEYICNRGTLMLTENSQEIVQLIADKDNFEQNDFYVLKLLLNIVRNTGKYRKTPVMTGFLINVTNLLINIGTLNNEKYTYQLIENGDLFCNLFKEIVFARPKSEIIHRITYLLKIGSRYTKFVEFLFIKKNRDRLQRSSKGILYYTDAVCPFCILGALIQNTLFKASTLALDVCHNMMSFFDNTLIVCPLLHHDMSGNVCACLAHLYRLQIDCIYEILNHIKNDRKNLEQYRNLLENEIIQKIMNFINFNNNDLVEKPVIDYSRFKEAEEMLRDLQYEMMMVNLSISDDVIEITADSFNNINL